MNFIQLYNKFDQLAEMPSHKHPRKPQPDQLESKRAPSPRPAPTIRFNLSVDNLRPFVEGHSYSWTRPFRSRSRLLPPATQRKAVKTEQSRPDTLSQHQSHPQTISRNGKSPDVAREVTNQIIREIEEKGINCDWKDGEEGRGQGAEDQGWQTSGVWSQQPARKNWSVASTSDHYSSYYNQYYQMDFYPGAERSRYYDPSYFQITVSEIGVDQRTTLMIKNIPNKYTVQLLAEEINLELANSYDFLYLPCDIKNNCNVGYGFINLLDCQALSNFYQLFHGRRWAKFKSEKICQLTYARLQGLGSLIEHFQNSKVLNHKDKKYQPIIRGLTHIEELIQQQQTDIKQEQP